MADFIRCECPYASYDHAAHGCRYGASYRVTRDGKRIAVCGDCTLPGDTERVPLSDDSPIVGQTTPGIGPSTWQSAAFDNPREDYARVVAERFGYDARIALFVVGNVYQEHDNATRERFIALAEDNARIAFHFARKVQQ